jgi:hypothetical protein
MNDNLDKIYDLMNEGMNGHSLNEALDPEKLAKMKSEFATPDMRPNNFDMTFEAWLTRIGTWGKTTITHNDPEFKTKNRKVTPREMIRKASDPTLIKAFGQFNIEQPDFNKVILVRKYKGMDGRIYREEFIVTNDLSRIKSRMNQR